MNTVKLTPAQVKALKSVETHENGRMYVTEGRTQTLAALRRMGVLYSDGNTLTDNGVNAWVTVNNGGVKITITEDGMEEHIIIPAAEVEARKLVEAYSDLEMDVEEIIAGLRAIDPAMTATYYDCTEDVEEVIARALSRLGTTQKEESASEELGDAQTDAESVSYPAPVIADGMDTRFMTPEEKSTALDKVAEEWAAQSERAQDMASAPESDWMYSTEEINKDRAALATWERELIANAGSLPVLPSPVMCQDCLINEATIFDMDAPSCDECERKYAAMNETPKIETVCVVQNWAGTVGVNHYHAPGCRDIQREAKRHGAQKDMGIHEGAFSSVAAIIEHEYADICEDTAEMLSEANSDYAGIRIMPCLSIPMGAIQGMPVEFKDGRWTLGNAPLDSERCTVCGVFGNVADNSTDIDGKHVCGYCVDNGRSPATLEKDSVPGFHAVAAYAERMNNYGTEAGFVEVMATMEYNLSVVVDETTGATVDLGWVTLTLNDAQKYSHRAIAEEYGRVHGQGTPRYGWDSIILVNAYNAL